MYKIYLWTHNLLHLCRRYKLACLIKHAQLHQPGSVSRSPSTPTPTSASPSSPFAQTGQIGLASVISTNRFSVLEDESAPPTPLELLHSTPASGLVDVCSTSSFPSRTPRTSRGFPSSVIRRKRCIPSAWSARTMEPYWQYLQASGGLWQLYTRLYDTVARARDTSALCGCAGPMQGCGCAATWRAFGVCRVAVAWSISSFPCSRTCRPWPLPFRHISLPDTAEHCESSFKPVSRHSKSPRLVSP